MDKRSEGSVIQVDHFVRGLIITFRESVKSLGRNRRAAASQREPSGVGIERRARIERHFITLLMLQVPGTSS